MCCMLWAVPFILLLCAACRGLILFLCAALCMGCTKHTQCSTYSPARSTASALGCPTDTVVLRCVLVQWAVPSTLRAAHIALHAAQQVPWAVPLILLFCAVCLCNGLSQAHTALHAAHSTQHIANASGCPNDTVALCVQWAVSDNPSYSRRRWQ